MGLIIQNLVKSYGQGEAKAQVLRGVSFSLETGRMLAICGNSGSGKSTLLNCIGGLESFEGGSILLDGLDLQGLSSRELLEYRRAKLGFVFQFYNLIANLTLEENVELCQHLSDEALDLDELFEVLALTPYRRKFPTQVSGGQQQRTAIARALIKKPSLLLCDEPTGALDSQNSREVLGLLERVNETYGTTMLLVTHNQAIRAMVDQVLVLKDGQVSENYENETRVPAARLEGL